MKALLEINQHTKQVRKLQNILRNTTINSKKYLHFNKLLTDLYSSIIDNTEQMHDKFGSFNEVTK